MKRILSILLIGFTTALSAQQPPIKIIFNVRDSLDIREQLVNQAMQNSGLEADEANIRIAEYNLKKAKTTWMDALGASANINEFVVNNSPAAIYYPKYNLGLNVPLSIFARQSNSVKVAKEMVSVSEVQKKEREKLIRTTVLTRYENYMEKKEQLQLATQATQEMQTTYLKAQKDYAANSIPLEQLNQTYLLYNTELSKQRTAQRDLNVAYIELEEMVGFRLKDILTQFGL